MHTFGIYNKKQFLKGIENNLKTFFVSFFLARFISFFRIVGHGESWIFAFEGQHFCSLTFYFIVKYVIKEDMFFFYKKYNHQIVQCNNIFVPRSTGAESSTVRGGWHAMVIWLKVQNDVMPIRIVFPFQVLDLIRHTRKHLHYTYWLFIHIKQKKYNTQSIKFVVSCKTTV